MLALDIQNLNKTYAGGVKALDNVSLQVRPGEFVGLLGPNGAGKTSLIGIINTLVTKTSGAVSAFGYDLERSPGSLKACIGTVPQEFNFSIFDKVWDIVYGQAGYFGMSPRLARERTDYCLKKVGLWEKRYAVSRTLSGGMKRRLMIARALVHEPRLLILDEPTAGVDVEMRQSMWRFLMKLNQQGVAILLTTHYLEEAEHFCERIAILHHGKIIRDTDKHQLMLELAQKNYLVDIMGELPDLAVSNEFDIAMVSEGRYKVTIKQQQHLNALFDWFDQHGVKVTTIESETGRLEEIFVNLTTNQGK